MHESATVHPPKLSSLAKESCQPIDQLMRRQNGDRTVLNEWEMTESRRGAICSFISEAPVSWSAAKASHENEEVPQLKFVKSC